MKGLAREHEWAGQVWTLRPVNPPESQKACAAVAPETFSSKHCPHLQTGKPNPENKKDCPESHGGRMET